jgi:hypothetical protein
MVLGMKNHVHQSVLLVWNWWASRITLKQYDSPSAINRAAQQIWEQTGNINIHALTSPYSNRPELLSVVSQIGFLLWLGSKTPATSPTAESGRASPADGPPARRGAVILREERYDDHRPGYCAVL